MTTIKRGTSAHYEPEQLVDLLYDEMLASACWSTTLAHLPAISHHGGWFLSAHDLVEDRPLYRLSTRGLERTEGGYQQHLYSVNTRLKRAISAPVGYVVRGSDTLTDVEFRDSEYYNDFLRQFDLFHVYGTVLHRDAQRAIAIGTLRSEREGDFNTAEVDLLSRLAPHLSRLLTIQPRLAELIRQRDTALEIGGQGRMAVFLVNTKGLVVEQNSVADNMIRQVEALSLRAGRLQFLDPQANIRLGHALSGPGKGAIQLFRLENGLGGSHLEVLVLPMQEVSESVFGDAGDEAAVAILLRDPKEQPFVRQDLVRDLFGLTEMEAGVACALANGFDTRRCCQLLDISVNTFKTHLKAVYLKTGVNSHASLVRQVLASVALMATQA